MSYIQKVLDKHIKSGGELLYDDEKEYEMLIKYIKSKDGGELIDEISNQIEQNKNTELDIIYEMFYEIKKVERFGIFFIEEFRRGFENAKIKQKPDSILQSLLALGPVYFKDSKIRHEILKIFFENVNDSNNEITHYAINFLNRWFEDKDFSEFKNELDYTLKNLKHQNWKIRYMAFLFLKKFDKELTDVSIGLMDKIKGKIGKPYSIK